MGTLSVDKLMKTSTGAAEFTLPATDGAAGTVLQTDGSGQLSVGEVTAAGIAASAVTATELADNAVVTNKVSDGALTAAKIADSAVITSKVAPSTWLPHRNMIINGAMQVAQRGGTVAGGTSNVYSPIDRWGLGSGSSFNFDVTASINTTTVNTEDGFAAALMITPDSTQTPTGSHNASIYYLMEGYDAQRLMQGGANAKTFTLSFYAKAVGKTGVYSVQCIKKDAAGAGRYQVKEFTVTTSWVRQEITFEADTSALIRNSNANDLSFYFSMACGPDDIVAPTNAWAPNGGIKAGTNQVNFMDSTSNEFHITGVQLEVGSNATPYEFKSFGQELAACQRYFEKSYNTADVPGVGSLVPGFAYSTNNGNVLTQSPGAVFKVTKRSNPTIVVYNGVTGASGKAYRTSDASSQTVTVSHVGQSAIGYLNVPSSENGYIYHYTADSEL